MDGKWLSVLEYAAFKKKSISTVRRYIKAKRVKFKEENGKYFIWTKNYVSSESISERDLLALKFENERFKKEIRILKDENAELIMLVNLYEANEKLIKKDFNLPDIPNELR